MTKKIYFTFDDGPSDTTELLLDILKKHQVKACFFVTNQFQRPDLLKRMAEEGHTIGLHSYSHSYEEVYSSPEGYFNDLQKIDDLVYETVGLRSKTLRFPGGSRNSVHQQYCPGIISTLIPELVRRGYRIIDWDCDNNDGSLINMPEKAYLAYFLDQIRGKEECVFLSHTRSADTESVLSVDSILDYCEKNGWEAGMIDSYDGPMLIRSEKPRRFVKTITRPVSPYLMLVNRDEMMSRFKAGELKLVSYEDVEGIPVRIERETLTAFLKMKYFLAGKGIDIGLGGAYRSVAEQKALWYQGMEQYGQDAEACMAHVALPWASEHHTGLAVDLLLGSGEAPSVRYERAAPEDERYRLIHRVCHRFGFILRYPEGKQEYTGFACAPWHLRYVGLPYAREMHRKRLTLEEYTALQTKRARVPEGGKASAERNKARRDKRYIQLLLLGCDVDDHKMAAHTATEEDRCLNSDAMVVLSLDRVSRQIRMISLMRDTWVDIPGHGLGKLNSAVVCGGPELAVQVVNSAFALNIKNYVLITVHDLVRLLDDFGGVDVKLTEAEAAYINEWMPNVRIITGREDAVPELTHGGLTHLNGMQTLAHVRNRTIGYMVGRENRTHDVLTAMAAKAKRDMTLPQLVRFSLRCRQYVRTDLRAPDILKLLGFGLGVRPDSIRTYHAPAEGTYTVKRDTVWRLETDFEKAAQGLWDFLEDRA